MNPSTDPVPAPSASSSLRGKVLKGCLAVAILALVPHLGKGYDIIDGLRLGPNATSNTASNSSIMLGFGNHTPGPNTMALGTGNNLGGSAANGNIAAGTFNTASGFAAFGFGSHNQATGSYTLASGRSNATSADYAMAHGLNNQAIGVASHAGGNYTIASGAFSTAEGYFTTAPSYASVAFGRFNTVPAGQDPNSWVASDQLFVIGNGTSDTSRNNALEVKKDGTVTIQKVPAKGGINMGIYQ